MKTLTADQYEAVAFRLENRTALDGGSWVMQTISAIGRDDLPRSAREMNFAAQDYERNTKPKDRTVDGIIDAMLNGERQPEWPA